MRIAMFEDRTTAHVDASTIVTPDMLTIRRAFQEAGHELRIVGGTVRDLLLGKDPKDIDFATTATPEEMKEIFENNGFSWIPTGEQHGTLTVLGTKDREPFEVTTLRIDTNQDGRHADVEFTRSWEKDASRRDLTYNAMSMDFDGNVFDYNGGLADLQSETTRFVGSPDERVREDFLRILRFFRFQSRFAHDIPDDELLAIKNNVDGLRNISGERMWMEMSKILSGNTEKLAAIIDTMQNLNVLDAIGFARKVNANDVELVRKLTDNPVTVLVALVKTHDGFNRLADKWKMSSAERNLGEFILDNLFENIGVQEAEDMLTDKVDPAWIQELFAAKGKPNPVATFTPTKFPVTGGDLIAQGHKPGPEMGNTLKFLNQEWKKSRFSLSKDELLRLSKPASKTIQR